MTDQSDREELGVLTKGSAPGEAASLQLGHLLRPGTLCLPALPPLSLYVHWPWCLRKCPYCDFNSHEHAQGVAAIPESDYLDALRADLEASLPMVWGRPVASIFIGGGTPSLISAHGIDRLLSDIRALLPLMAGCEITLEANPASFEADKFAAFRRSGVNRLSIGVQSFDSGMLQRLGRVHDRDEALAAIEVAQRHFDNVNLDLMFALPGQSLTQAKSDVEQALAFGTQHLSLYQLTVEPNTVFAKFPPRLPDEDDAAAIQQWIESRMKACGYRHYEVSAFACEGRECRHNLNYWHFGDYLGIGAGAHSKLSFPQRIVRQVRPRNPASYLAQAAIGQLACTTTEVARRDLPFEFMLNALRLCSGYAGELFSERTGLPPNAIAETLLLAEFRGLIKVTADRVAPTELGRRFLSDLQAMFLPKTAPSRSICADVAHNAPG